ncbi:Transmembrane protein 87A [Lamellibrachia satsuma]|nr:Transmembrane protein 87A [Lamellibrachia satsuma]
MFSSIARRQRPTAAKLWKEAASSEYCNNARRHLPIIPVFIIRKERALAAVSNRLRYSDVFPRMFVDTFCSCRRPFRGGRFAMGCFRGSGKTNQSTVTNGEGEWIAMKCGHVHCNSSDSYLIFPNYLYKDSFVAVSIFCNSKAGHRIKVHWILEEIRCMRDMYKTQAKVNKAIIDLKHRAAASQSKQHRAGIESENISHQSEITYQLSSQTYEFECGEDHVIHLQDESDRPYFTSDIVGVDNSKVHLEIHNKSTYDARRPMARTVTRTWRDGMYHFLLSISPANKTNGFTASVHVEMRGRWGFLPAIDWPKLPYSGVMSFLYLMVGTAWLFIWALAQQHTHKIHVVIGLVAVSGAIAHTLLFVHLSNTGHSGYGIAALSWLSRTTGVCQDCLLDVLLMVVSTGYGITRPKLGRPIVGVIVALCCCRFVTGLSLEVVRDEHLKIKYDHEDLYIVVKYVNTAITLVIGGWIMVASLLTSVHLCTRKHSTKLMVFSVFMGACTLAFVAYLGMALMVMIWSRECQQDWQHAWLVPSFGEMVNFVLLIVLMWLWRPVDQAHSYSFSPLTTTEYDEPEEEDDEDEEEIVIMDKASLEPM